MDKEEVLKLIGKECIATWYPDGYNKGMIIGYCKTNKPNIYLPIIGYYTDYYIGWNKFNEYDIQIIKSPMFKSYGYCDTDRVIIQ